MPSLSRRKPRKVTLTFSCRRTDEYSPLDIATLVAWWDFSDLSTLFKNTAKTTPVTANGDLIACVEDKSGANRNLLQATESLRPQYEANAKNNLGVCTSSDQTNWLRATFTLAQPYSIYFVGKATFSTNRRLLDGVTAQAFMQSPNTTQLQMYAGSFGTASNKLSSATWGIVTTLWSGASSGWYLNNGTITSNNIGTNSPGGVTLFGSAAGGSQIAGSFGEVIVVSSLLSTDDKSALITYLNNKWSIYA